MVTEAEIRSVIGTPGHERVVSCTDEPNGAKALRLQCVHEERVLRFTREQVSAMTADRWATIAKAFIERESLGFAKSGGCDCFSGWLTWEREQAAIGDAEGQGNE